MWIWWVMVVVVLLGLAAAHDWRQRSRFRRSLSPDLSRADRREALRLRRAEVGAHSATAGHGWAFGMDGGGGHVGGFDGGGCDGGGGGC